ncbi:phosphoribosylanthranilate isomerase [Candidatus Pelagibacter sp.]|nr:phosphoribosylanthranilate isomerase [Candidatus Pelagibacter sp.]
MIQPCKICGISDSKTLEFLTSHPTPPKMIGFICNWPKSKRFVEHNKLKELLKVDKRKSEYVAVLVKPNKDTLEKIKDLPFDYYQLYDCTAAEVKSIKEKYNKKIIVAITVKDQNDTVKYLEYNELADIILFDSKGYEKSMSFDHQLIKNIKINKELMLAGDIQIEDKLENYREIADIIDISGGLETSGLKDISKINIFLNKIKLINNEA